MCQNRVRDLRRRISPGRRGAARAARHRGLYRRGDRFYRLRTAGTGGGRKRAARARAHGVLRREHRQRQGEKALPRSAPGYLSNGRMRRFYERAHGAGRDGVHRRHAKLRALPGRSVLRGAPLRRGSALPRAAGEKTAPDRKPAGAASALRRYVRRAAARRHGASRLDVGAAERPFAGRAGNRRALRRSGAHFQPCRMAYDRI